MAEKKKRTTMSVAEMRRILGLGKTDSYWLIHKECFKTVLINGKMRVDIASFEKWYSNQVKHKKVDGPPPGEELKVRSYSPREAAAILGIDESSFYYLIKRDHIPTILVDAWIRIPKEAFDTWYKSQKKHRTAEDKERDRELEESTLTMPEMAKELGITRSNVYSILKGKRNQGKFEIVTVADKKRITKESFEKWYVGQDRYIKVSDRPEKEQKAIELNKKVKKKPRLIVEPDKATYSVPETAVLLDITVKEVYEQIRCGNLEVMRLGNIFRIRRDDIHWWLAQQKKELESEE